MTPTLLPRVLGLITLGYGGYTLSRPHSLAAVAGLADRSAPTAATLALGRLIGIRDISSGIAMVAAPAGAPLQAAVIARVLCDLSDAIALGSAAPKTSRPKVLAVTLGWAATCAPGLRWAGKKR